MTLDKKWNTYTLPFPDLSCVTNQKQLTDELVLALRASLAHMISVVRDFEYPPCDICDHRMRDDFKQKGCHIESAMMDLADVEWGPDAGIGKLPYPTDIQESRFKWGEVTTANKVRQGVSTQVQVTFEPPFPTAIKTVLVTPVEAVDDTFFDTNIPLWERGDPNCGAGGMGLVYLMHPFVRERNRFGFKIWIAGDDFDCEARIKFMWFAIGE